jgi:hypothetical protein
VITPTPVITGGRLTATSFSITWSDTSSVIGRAQLNVVASHFSTTGCRGDYISVEVVDTDYFGQGSVPSRVISYPGFVVTGQPVVPDAYYWASMVAYDPDVPGSRVSNCFYLGHN